MHKITKSMPPHFRLVRSGCVPLSVGLVKIRFNRYSCNEYAVRIEANARKSVSDMAIPVLLALLRG
jgi:hypothetical protein